jgi:hypothetical protein
VRIAKWALVLTAAASFGTAARVLTRTGDSGTAATPLRASVTPVLEDDQGEEGRDDLFGSGSIAAPEDFGGSLPP